MAPACLLPRHLLDELVVVVAQHRDHPLLHGAADVLGAQHRRGAAVEQLLQVVQHRPRAAAAPGRGVAEGVQLLRGIAQPAGAVGDLRVGPEHDPVGATQRQHHRHAGPCNRTRRAHHDSERPAAALSHDRRGHLGSGAWSNGTRTAACGWLARGSTSTRIAFAVADPEHRFSRCPAAARARPARRRAAISASTPACWSLDLPRPPADRHGVPGRAAVSRRRPETDHRPGQPAARPRARSAPSRCWSCRATPPPAWLDRAPPWPVHTELAVDTAVGPVEVTVRSPGAADPAAAAGPRRPGVRRAGRARRVRRGARAGRPGAPVPPRAGRARGARRPLLGRPGATPRRWPPGCCRELHRALGTSGPAVLMGASLGALAVLHLQRRHPDLVAGMFLQSGQLLHPGAGRLRVRLPALRPDRRGGRRRAPQPPGRPPGADRAHLRRGRGEPAQQPAAGRQRCAGRATRRRCARCRTRTTTWPGGTRSTRTWPSCWRKVWCDA